MNGYIATIGMFDGVHRGHQFVLRQVVELAHQRGMHSMAITFDTDGRKGDDNKSTSQLLSPLSDKLQLLSKTGIDRVEVLPFTDELRRLTARQFMSQVLRNQFDVRVLLTGFDNRFGHNRAEGFSDYVRYGHELGIEVRQLPAEGSVSSSLIRQLLSEGRVAEAADALGYPYTIPGHVEHGQHVGTGLGFPTANLCPDCPRQLIPAPGVYAVKVRTENSAELKQGMMNIGYRPTFDGHRLTLETHIFQFSDDLYGQRLSVSFVERLRDECRFADAASLKAQLQLDMEQAKQALEDER